MAMLGKCVVEGFVCLDVDLVTFKVVDILIDQRAFGTKLIPFLSLFVPVFFLFLCAFYPSILFHFHCGKRTLWSSTVFLIRFFIHSWIHDGTGG